MILIVGMQMPSPFQDMVCDLCREVFNSGQLITADINAHHPDPLKRKTQLTSCPSCLGKLAKGIQAYLANLIVDLEEEEIIQL